MPDVGHSQGRIPIVHIVLKKSCDKKHEIEEEVKSLCQKELPEYAQPVHFLFQDNLPLTPIGKVDYRALEKEAEK